MGPSERHVRRALDHGDEIRQPGDVRRPGRTGAHHGCDLRNDPAHVDLLPEEIACPSEHGTTGLLDPGPRRVDQPHDRDALAKGQLAHPGGLQLADHPDGAGHDGEVVGDHANSPPIDPAHAGHHTVGGGCLALHLRRRGLMVGEEAELGERAGVEQQIDALPDGELGRGVLPRHAFRSTHRAGLRAPVAERRGMPAEVGTLVRVGDGAFGRRRASGGIGGGRAGHDDEPPRGSFAGLVGRPMPTGTRRPRL